MKPYFGRITAQWETQQGIFSGPIDSTGGKITFYLPDSTWIDITRIFIEDSEADLYLQKTLLIDELLKDLAKSEKEVARLFRLVAQHERDVDSYRQKLRKHTLSSFDESDLDEIDIETIIKKLLDRIGIGALVVTAVKLDGGS